MYMAAALWFIWSLKKRVHPTERTVFDTVNRAVLNKVAPSFLGPMCHKAKTGTSELP